MDKFWIRVHVYLSMFFLPAAVIYAVTGALCVCGIRGDTRPDTTIDVKLETPVPRDIQALANLAAKKLQENGLKVPQGDPEMKRGAVVLGKYTGYYASLKVSPKTGEGELTVRRPGLYRILMLLHLAAGGTVFNVLAVAFSISMVVIYVSGIIPCWQSPRLRKAMFWSLGIGTVVTVAAVYLSV